MDMNIILKSIQKYRYEVRKNAIERNRIRSNGITRLWFKGTTLVDMDIQFRRT
jgi:hypothetical protein